MGATRPAVTRRDFVRLAGTAGLVLASGTALVACGGAGSASATPAASVAASGAAAASANGAASAAPSRPAASPAVSRSGPLDKVSVALPTIAQSQAAYLVARENGYYAQDGIEPGLQVVAPNLGVQGAAAGSYTFSGSAAQAAIARLGGAPLKVVFNPGSSITWWLTANQKSGVKTVEGLKGKTMAIEGPGTLSATFTQALLRKHGLNPDTDIKFVGVGAVANWLPAVIGGAVDAGIAPDSDSYLKGKQQGLVELAWYGKELHATLSGAAVSDKLLSEKPDLVKRFLRATIKGLRAYKANKSQSVSIMAKLTKLPEDEVSAAYDIESPLTLSDGILDEPAQRDFLDLAAQTLKMQGSVDPKTVYAYDLTGQAAQELAAEHWSP